MMPGEAPAAGIAAEAATACANCSALQQNLNEYVAALIALKQKIIDTDRLLTEYQQKCNELQLAKRENNTLRHQVEQMLQKISPLEKCQQELGSLKAELEEKKSSLKIYQETHLEYARVKEEIVRSDAVKKKLEAKVKKLEEAATKHMQDFRQLKTEKKVLEKELKKAQEKLDDFPKQKCKKVLKHAETQSAREDPVANIDKGKIKLLLEELWMCIDSSTGKRQNQENDYVLASVKGRTRTPEKTGKLFTEEVEQSHRKFRKSNGKMPYPHSPPETIGKQNSLTTLQIKVDKEPHRGDHFESKTTEECLQDYNGDNAFYEDKTIKVVVQTDLTDSSSDSSDQEQEQFGGNLLDILSWVRPLPPLLSPVRFSPPAMQDTLFGESTNSSDEEIDHNAHIVESILEGKAESQSNCNFVSVKESNEHEKPHEPNDREISTKLRENEETPIYIDTFSAKSSYVREKDAEGKQTEMTVSSMNILAREEHSEEDSENIGPEERERTVKVATPKLEAINEKEVHTDQIHSVEEVLSSTCMSSSFQYLQEKSSELVPTEKTIATNLNTTANSEHMKEKSHKLMEAEIQGEVETPKPASTLRDGVHLQTGEPIFATESVLVTPEDFEEEHREMMGNEAMENESSDIQTKSNVVTTTLCIEKHVEKVETAQGQVIATVITEGFCVETNNEPRHNEEGDVRSSFSNSKSFFGAEHDNELVCQCNSERMLMQTEIYTEAKDISTKSQCSEEKFSNEETLDKQCEHTKQHGVNEEGGLESNNTFRHDSFVLATERSRDSLYIDGENHIAEVCKIAHSVSEKGGDAEQLRTGEQCVEVNLARPEQKVFTGSSANKEDFLETCKFAKSLHVMEVGEVLDAKEERCLQAKLDHEQKDASKLLQKKPDFETTVTSPNPAFGINVENDPLEPEEIVKTSHLLHAPEHVTEKASEMRQDKNTFIASEHRSSKFQNCIEVFEPQGIEMEMDHSEVRERHSGPLETEKINTVKSVITESECASWAQFFKPVNSCSITENSQCDKIRKKLNDKPCEAVVIHNCNNSPDLEENGAEEVEMRNQISDVTDHVVSEENAIEELALSIGDVLETGSIDTEEINTPVTVAVGLESTAMSTDFTAVNLQVCDEPLKQNCQAFDTTSVDFVTALSTASSLTRGNENCNDHIIQSMPNYSLGNVVEGKTIHDKEKIKPLDCLSNKYENKNRAEIENEKEQPSAKEPQKTLVNTQILGTSSFDSCTHTEKEASLVFEEAECETCSWKEIITERVVLKETSPHRVDHLWSSEGQVRKPTEDRSDETIKNKGKELNIKLCEEKNGNKTSENTSEVPEERDESEEDIPFRKVKYTKQHEPFLASTEKLKTFRTYTVDVPAICTAVDENNDQMCELPPSVYSDALADMAIPCVTNHSPSIVKELSCLTKKVCLKDKLFTTHGTVFHNDENNERASEHRENSKIIGSVPDNENSLIKLEESSTSAEVSEKIPTKQTTSEINLLPHQMLAKCSEIYKNAIKNSKLDTGMSGNFLQINHDEKLESNMEQSVSCNAGIEVSKAHTVFCEELNDKEEEIHAAFASVDINTNIAQDSCQSCYDGSCSDAFLNETDFQRKDKKENSVKNYQHPPLSDEISDPKPVNQTSEQKAVFENAYVMESESSVGLISKNNHRSEWKVQELSNVLNVSAKALIQAGQSRLTQRLPRVKEKTKTSQVQVTQPVLANADTSTPTKQSSETINKIRQEMGPPLPPLLLPLIATPPRTLRPVSPIMSSSSRSSLPSPLDDLISPLRDTPLPPLMSPLSDAPKYKSPPIFSTPSPSETAVGQRILSSPLQFCAATPKHALPVPGRLPPSAAGSAASDVSQENSVKILDTIYPELSARARTLNILKGNIQPNRCAPSESKNIPGQVSQFSGFKAISSTSTAFVKTGSNSESHCSKDQKDSGCQSHVGKRTLSASMPRSAKRLRLDSESPQFETKEDVAIKAIGDFNIEVQSAAGKTLSLNNSEIRQLTELPSPVENIIDPVALVLKKIAESCFDLLPVIRSQVYVGNISKVPVMRDEEKEVVCEFGIANKHLAKPLLRAILSKLKTQKMSLNHNFTQALCRVYVGICRQLGDLERARLFCYSLLKEDFPESAKLTLFITNVWDDIFSFQGVINKAMQLVARQRARGEVLHCLSAYLSWEKSPPLDTGIMVSSLLLAIQLCPKMEFQLSERYGEDLSESTWECILAIDLLCSHLKWGWTHDNIISKELWPVMDKWVKHRKGHETIPSTPDIIVASTLRLIGRLCQIGLKEGFFSAVKNISFVIGRFIQHAKEEDVPWGVQLAAVYALCDLGPSNPVGVVEAIRSWRTVITNSIPAAVTSGIAEISSLCTVELH